MMIVPPITMTIPLHTDEDGVIRIGDTPIALDAVIARFQQGATPQDIHASFDALTINDIYAVIAYYLAHRDDLDTYIQRRAEQGEHLRREWEAIYPPQITRADLEHRLASRKVTQDE